jgi:sulfoxide reductase catalytic subunit YedY
MTTRREAVKLLTAGLAGAYAFFGSLNSGLRLLYAKTRKIVLPKGTEMASLIGKDPADLDTSHLEVTPMEEFDTMGLTNHTVDIENWRLGVTGKVERPVSLEYADLLKRPGVERDVLLICPGVFAYNGRWKGVSAADLLSEAGLRPDVTHVVFTGPSRFLKKSERFTLEEVVSGKIFLAYQVNGVPLPEKHGYPLRLVAEGRYGHKWVKYVDTIEAE